MYIKSIQSLKLSTGEWVCCSTRRINQVKRTGLEVILGARALWIQVKRTGLEVILGARALWIQVKRTGLEVVLGPYGSRLKGQVLR